MALGGRLRESWRAFAAAFQSPQLRRLQLAGFGSTLGIWVYAIAIAVYAYRKDGATAIGIVLFARWSLAAVCAPWLAVYADRGSRRRVMLVVDFSRAALVVAITANVAAGGPSLLTYVLAVLVSVISAAFSPAQAALLPSLARTPEELTASNLALNTIASVGSFAGPAVGGLALAFSGPWLVFALTAAGYLWSGVCVLGLEPDEPPPRTGDGRVAAEFLAGFAAVGSERRLQLVVAQYGLALLVCGALEVALVVEALRVLHAGNAGVGWLNTALGLGGLLGGGVGIALTARKKLAGDFGLGLVLLGAPLAVVALFGNLAVALVLFGVMGVGGTVFEVAGVTLLQRAAPPQVVGRVFGVLESLSLAALAVGALVAPLLIHAVGPRAAFAVTGLLLPVSAALTWRSLASIDRAALIPLEPLELLRAIAIFTPLPAPVLERLAAGADEVHVAAGTDVFRQGDAGDRFYVIADGTAAVEIDDTDTRELTRGDFFGEIALLRDVPRTATVRAVDDLRLFALQRDDFIAAVTGHAPSREAADSVVAARLPALG